MAAKVGTPRWTILLIFTLSCYLAQKLILCSSQIPTNSIKAGEALRYSDKLLVSANGGFQLGFFNTSHTTTKGFLGIRYTDELETHMVWVANRNAPFNGSSVTLTMDADGLLKIVRSGGGTITVNHDRKAPNSTATLENSGNLVVRSETNQVVWESFDHPTDTLLPGMKLGSNHVSGKKWVLSSWLSLDSPGTGAFTLEYNHSGTYFDDAFVVRRRGSPFSTNGRFIIDRFLDGKKSYISDETETYFNLSARSGVVGLKLRLDPDGRIEVGNANQSETYITNIACNGGVIFQFECAGTNTPACRSGNDNFVKRGFASNMSSYSDTNSSIIISDCLEQCVRDCSCVAFSTLYADETGCNFWREGAQFGLTESSLLAKVFVQNSRYQISASSQTGNKRWIWFVIFAMALMA